MNKKNDYKLSALKKVFPISEPNEQLLIMAHEIVEKGVDLSLSYKDIEILVEYIQILLKQRKFV